MTMMDGHTHLFAPSQVAERDAIAAREPTFAEMYSNAAAKMAVRNELRHAMTDAGLDRAAAAGFAFDSAEELARQNAYLLECQSDGISVLATLNPCNKGWESAAREAVSAGAVGFGELRPHNQGWDPLGGEGRALCALAEELGVVLLWHASEPVGHLYPGKFGGITPAELIELALEFPAVTMIGAHLGAGASFFLQMPELYGGIERLYFDTAASSFLYDEGSVARVIEIVGAERVLFGSDFPLQSPKRQIERLRASLPPKVLDAILGETAATIFPEQQE